MTNDPSSLRVLVVDDEPLVRWALAETLAAAGAEVIEAADGQQAIHALAHASARVDVVLLDYALPNTRHFEVLAALRQIAPATPIVLMTVFLHGPIAREALARGACRVVAKPIEMTDVPTLVRDAVRQSPPPVCEPL